MADVEGQKRGPPDAGEEEAPGAKKSRPNTDLVVSQNTAQQSQMAVFQVNAPCVRTSESRSASRCRRKAPGDD
jgi:hypothetical protein